MDAAIATSSVAQPITIDAESLVSRAAGAVLMCAISLDAVAHGDFERDVDASDVACIASETLFDCWGDLTAAIDIASRS